MAEDLKELVIDRSKWGMGRLRRVGDACPPDSKRRAGKMCCLGFYCLAAGVPLADLDDVHMPRRDTMSSLLPEWMFGTADDDVWALAFINDSTSYGDAFKEPIIIEIFAKHGTKVTFVGGDSAVDAQK